MEQSSPVKPPLSGIRLVIAVIAVGFGTLLITLDQFIANVSIPSISGELGVSQDHGAWVITSYTIASAVTIPMTGWLTSMIGRVRLFAISCILFSVMSFLCGLSVSLPMLLSFRILQGLVSGSLIPLSQTLLLFLFPGRRGMAMGFWGLVIMVGPALGPVAGGWLTSNYGWPWIFYINVPGGILAGIVALSLLSAFESERIKLPIDLVGIALLFLTVGSFQLMLDRGYDLDWWRSHYIVALTVVAVISLTFLLIWEHFHPHPVFDLSFFKSRNFTLGSIVIGLSVMVLFGNLIVGPLWVQAQLGYTPLWAGYTLAPLGLTALIVFPLVGIFLDRLETRVWVVIGFALMLWSFYWISTQNIHVPFGLMVLPRFIQGVGFALIFVPLITMSLAGIPEKKMASATGVFSFIRMVFISMGISISISRWMRRENFFQSRFGEFVIPSNPQFEPTIDTLKSLGLEGKQPLAALNQMVMNQAFTETYLEMSYQSAWIFVGLFILLFAFRSRKAAERRAGKIS